LGSLLRNGRKLRSMESDDPAGDDIGDDDGEDSSTSISITKLPCPPSLASSAPKFPKPSRRMTTTARWIGEADEGCGGVEDFTN
jgi:hypothetical protein